MYFYVYKYIYRCIIFYNLYISLPHFVSLLIERKKKKEKEKYTINVG